MSGTQTPYRCIHLYVLSKTRKFNHTCVCAEDAGVVTLSGHQAPPRVDYPSDSTAADSAKGFVADASGIKGLLHLFSLIEALTLLGLMDALRKGVASDSSVLPRHGSAAQCFHSKISSDRFGQQLLEMQPPELFGCRIKLGRSTVLHSLGCTWPELVARAKSDVARLQQQYPTSSLQAQQKRFT